MIETLEALRLAEPEPTIRLGDLDADDVIELDDGKAQQYSAWAERMRTKREEAKEAQRAAVEGPSQQGPAYWSSEAVFAESKLIEEQEQFDQPNPSRVGELLAVLGLSKDADAAQIASAYRTLAKRHHPDRFASADEATQQEHADHMAAVNRAYSALKQLDLV